MNEQERWPEVEVKKEENKEWDEMTKEEQDEWLKLLEGPCGGCQECAMGSIE